jgi:hypothetical protein
MWATRLKLCSPLVWWGSSYERSLRERPVFCTASCTRRRDSFEPEDEVQSYINQQFVTKGCQLVHYNVLIDSHNNLVYDFVWLCPDDNAVKKEPPVSQSDVP